MASINSLHALARDVSADTRFRTSDWAHPTPLAQPLARIGKRAFDIAASALLLLLLSPLMVMAALHVRRDDGPALFRQDRLGRDGRGFICLKFRSMPVGADRLLRDILACDPAAAAEWDATQKLRRDPRVTATGRLIRTTSIDELPQLINVLRGDMSLVGPRPIVRSELRHYGRNADFYMLAKPGLTGLWQVSGRSDTTYQRRVKLDSDYVRNWTFWLDIAILLKTVVVIVSRRGAV